MINTQFRTYDYFAFGEKNDYGQEVLIKDENGNPVVQGTVKMAINISSQGVQDNINYKNAQYVGITMDKTIDDNKVIAYGDEMLKVLYVNPVGRYIQVFLGEI